MTTWTWFLGAGEEEVADFGPILGVWTSPSILGMPRAPEVFNFPAGSEVDLAIDLSGRLPAGNTLSSASVSKLAPVAGTITISAAAVNDEEVTIDGTTYAAGALVGVRLTPTTAGDFRLRFSADTTPDEVTLLADARLEAR